MLADSHLHLFSHGFPGPGGRPLLGRELDVNAYEALMAAHGIGVGLVVGYTADGIDPGNNDNIRALADDRPWMATAAYVETAPAPDASALAAFLDAGHAGIAVYATDAGRADAVAAWPRETWAVLADRGAIVSFNARPEAMPSLAPIVAREEGIRFLFSHLGLPGRHPEVPTASAAEARLAGLLALAGRQNVHVKVSGLYAISDPAHFYPHPAALPFVDAVLDRFGPERCLWGSDFSVALEFVSFMQTLSIPWLDQLSGEERRAVMGGNLLRLLGRRAPAQQGYWT